MNKLIALVLAIVLMTSLSATAFAADNTINYNSSQLSQSSGLNVTYNVQPNFTVTIPPTVGLGSSVTVSTADVVVEYGKAVKVRLAETSAGDNAFVLTTPEGASISYTVKKGNTNVQVGDVILTATPTSTDTSVTLDFVAPKNITYAGNYTGTITFSIAVEGE